MNLGWLCYGSLRTDLYAPIDTPERFHAALPLLRDAVGGPIHWFPFRSLGEASPGECPDGARAEERLAHQCVVNYADGLRDFVTTCNHQPAQGRKDAMDRLAEGTVYDAGFGYQLPTLDAVIIECSGMMGAAWPMDLLTRFLWQLNPNLGIILSDLDCSATHVASKMRRWHPATPDRVIVAAQHNTPVVRYGQVVNLWPHPVTRELPTAEVIRGVGFVGNDYEKREAMGRLFTADWVHWHGRVKRDWKSSAEKLGCTLHPPLKPTGDYNVEQLYNYYGVGVNVTRPEAVNRQVVTSRTSQIVRGGALAVAERNTPVYAPLVGEHCLAWDVNDLHAIMWNAANSSQWHADTVRFQREQHRRYTSTERYVESLLLALQTLNAGPVPRGWRCNPYADLYQAAGLAKWRKR